MIVSVLFIAFRFLPHKLTAQTRSWSIPFNSSPSWLSFTFICKK